MDIAGAEKALRASINLDPFAVAARAALGRLLADSGRNDEAAQELQDALDLLPGYGEAAMALAELEWRRGNHTPAMHTIVDLLTVDPYHFEALARLGTWLLESGAARDAATAFERVLSFAPEHPVAREGLERALAATPSMRAG
jgi:tetratricopeptide (TPR) repeat protein